VKARYVQLLWIATALGLFNFLAFQHFYWPGSVFEGRTSGVWAALAQDVSRGEFYRPLLDSQGYGGTRYMPLFFTLHGLLWRWMGDGVSSGLVMVYVSGLLTLSAVYALLRHQQLPHRLALPLTGLLLGTLTFERLSVELRGDMLASAAVLWAVLCVEKALRKENGQDGRWLVAAGMWTLVAFFTKFTSLYILIFLAWRLRSRVFVGSILALCTGGLGLLQWMSQGRFWENFAPVATGGIMHFSWDILPLAFQNFGDGVICCDPFAYVICLVPIVVSLRALWHRFRSKTDDLAIAWPGRSDLTSGMPFLLLLALVTVVTIAIFSSPGTWINHIVDLLCCSLFVLGRMFLPQSTAWRSIAGRICFFYALIQLGMLLIPGCPSTRQTMVREGVPRVAMLEEIHRRYLPAGTVYFTDNPIVAVAVGDRPFVLDEFNLRFFLRDGHPIGQDFYQKVYSGYFQVAVCDNGPLDSDFDSDTPVSPELTERYWASRPIEYRFLRDYFVLVAVHRPFAVLAWRRPSDP